MAMEDVRLPARLQAVLQRSLGQEPKASSIRQRIWHEVGTCKAGYLSQTRDTARFEAPLSHLRAVDAAAAKEAVLRVQENGGQSLHL